MDKIWWFAIHVVAILGQLALGIVGVIEYTRYTTSADATTGYLSGQISFSEETSNFSILIAPTVLGFVGTVFTLVIFVFLQRADRASGQAAHFNRNATTLIGGILEVAFVIGDIAVAATLGTHHGDPFVSSCAASAVAAALLAFAVAFDLIKLYTLDRADAKQDREMYEFQRV
ncbi:uncharacterized protein F4822DRAFT_424865 [Hypoxylon trugodes]|uniref:uncharacterized protein n=1 Tax=Hypoxylon trugodes TaxID=326681 RepID=UPI00218EA306|nr:uncharacterized protein F4822DRAFT_424865 [Hypoxylon trugodes]KAI1394386.1 hypothetical protein F4822DRAFT_424865 [Hypoxylon trugodes]